MQKKERALTPAEQARKEWFDALCQSMAENGYDKKDLTVGIVFANIAAIFVMLPFAFLLLVWFSLFHPSGGGDFTLSGYWLLLLGIILFTVLHEGIHGLTWGLFTKGHFQSISFGVIWKYLTPYCTCREPLTRGQYLLGCAMPTVILGFGLGAVSVFAGSPVLLALAVIMLFGGGGDFLIILKILFYKTHGGHTVYCDHPYECGVVVFDKANP